MKIDLSKYPSGTKFRLRNEKIVTLIGKSFAKNNNYVIEYPNGDVGHRNQEGQHLSTADLDVASIIQPDKYLVSYKDITFTIRSIVIVDPKSLTIDSFYEAIKLVTTEDRRPCDVLSWSKIEE